MKIISWLWAQLRNLFGRPKDVPLRKKRKYSKRAAPEGVSGDFTDLRSLLDKLDYYNDLIGTAMKRSTDKTYDLLFGVGIYIYGDTGSFNVSYLEGVEPLEFPAVMSLGLFKNDTADDYLDCVLFAEKMTWTLRESHQIQRPHGDWYYKFGGVGVYASGQLAEVVTYIGIKNSDPYLLNVFDSRYISIPCKKNRHSARRVRGYIQKTHRKVFMPYGADMSTTQREAVSPEEHTLQMFAGVYNGAVRRAASTEVVASKGRVKMAFSVPMHEWKTFFKERIDVRTESGAKKRIFHHVAAHTRKNGQVVKMHSRGLTEFKWQGYNAKILAQKRGRGSVLDFTTPPNNTLPGPDQDKFMDGAEVAGALSDHMEAKL